jgi:hypothetical protein
MGFYSKPLLVFTALLSVSAFFLFAKRPERFLASMETSSLRDGYCLAIRGNGEAMPAHWGAMANAIETFGIPSGVAGGSSASISSFLLESVLMNPSVSQQASEEKVSFLLKSFEGLFAHMAKKPEWQELINLIKMLDGRKKSPPIAELQKMLEKQSPDQILLQMAKVSVALQEIQNTSVLNGPAIVRLVASFRKWKSQPSEENKAELVIRLNEAKRSFEVLGKFDAKNDKHLFIRNGIIHFGALANLFGKMGDFYSLRGASQNTSNFFQSWIEDCSPKSAGKSWSEIVEGKKVCERQLEKLLDIYIAETKNRSYRIHEKVGATLPAIISTSVVVGTSIDSVKKTKADYDQRKDDSFESEIFIQREDVKFGYWGASEDLRRIESVIHSSRFPGSRIDKSKRFLSLNEAKWIVPLSLSPAEPGLSSFLEFEKEGEKLLSFGGWSDLHPVPVLKALGCGKVVYLTRVGGDTLFGQGVAKRIFQLEDIQWEDLDSTNPAAIKKNNFGTRENQNGNWSQMFNLANSRSSFSFSLAMADAVVCTNWNDFDVKTEFRSLVLDAYRSPVYIRGASFGRSIRDVKRIYREDNSFDSELGYPRYVGCIYP